MYQTTSDVSGVKALCIGQVLPGYEINKSSETNFLSFKVGDNVYYVTQAKVYEALAIDENKTSLGSAYSEDKITMTQGQNYVLTITVSKTQINSITATLADWTTIEGNYDRNNAYLTFSFSDYSNTNSQNFTLYRSKYTYSDPVTGTGYTANYDWNTGYKDNAATLTGPTGDSKVWSTAWYWDSNKDFYHFRMVGKGSAEGSTALTITSEGSGDTEKEYFEIKSGKDDGNYRWGAPMASGKTLSYDNKTYGFDGASANENTHNISEAIGATESTIHLTEVNTLAKIVVKLATSNGYDKVTFVDGENKTKVEMVNMYTAGKVYMGNGLVVATGDRSTTATAMTANGSATEFNYYVVPQALKDNNTYVTFKITTPDGNVYYVKEKLSEIQPTTVKNGTNVSIGQTTSDKITYWYPNCTYTYNFKLTKTGISTITATLVPYTEITGANTDITIED